MLGETPSISLSCGRLPPFSVLFISVPFKKLTQMTPLLFNVDLVSGKLFGAITDRGHLPAFFTDQDKAEVFFKEKNATGILGRCDKLYDLRSSLEFHENTYVLVDEVVLTMREFTERFMA